MSECTRNLLMTKTWIMTPEIEIYKFLTVNCNFCGNLSCSTGTPLFTAKMFLLLIHACYHPTLTEVQSIRPFARRSVNSMKVLQWWSMRKYFEALINNQYKSFQNNIAQLYFTLWTAELCLKFSTIPKDGSDIWRFSKNRMHWEKSLNIRAILRYSGEFQT